MTHLLHQMVHHRTTLRRNGQRSATIARITTHTHTHTTILNIKGSHQSLAPWVSPAGDPNPQARLGAGRYPTQRRQERSLSLPL